jgi:hypothetical protein
MSVFIRIIAVGLIVWGGICLWICIVSIYASIMYRRHEQHWRREAENEMVRAADRKLPFQILISLALIAMGVVIIVYF